jgi:hypothetical protein
MDFDDLIIEPPPKPCRQEPPSKAVKRLLIVFSRSVGRLIWFVRRS